ncbi:MAG: HAD-IIB family hydrolase [Methylobacter sp.]|nr:HAD-IIB family hydrolase [Methylobacter sp.]MDP2427589.1 HAD-IIB family hydrolase [Methylobacter sp.]MDP3054230.1 HAD-IIB family hydrolase [Methylobacter sp.]MDP3364061.1 HAD-IIB family hydrolase [Methylobacter sp.]MDZ4218366.1 HAD-IIB family hydrolase [Methylobacter sp.]
MSSKKNSRYILLISIHGLIRGQHLELGRDADTGGQTKYVVDLARALAAQESVGRVDLATRLIIDPEVDADYRQETEALDKGAQIVRIPAGPEGYLKKEELWDYLDIFADNLLNWLRLQPKMPDIIHSHYADAGYVGVRLSLLTGIPQAHTGHSLGRDKLSRLLAMGSSGELIEQRYHISRRINAEEDVLANADLVVTSTHNEIAEQYELYDYYQPDCMVVIPPGTDLEQFYPAEAKAKIAFSKTLDTFLSNPKKPMILALSRPDERKNITSLVQAYGESAELQELANLVIVAGNRDDIREMDEGAQAVLTDILLLSDCYDLYGHIAIPKHHSQSDVPDIYRLAALSKGVFVNPALTEPFGLTLLEAAACGLPLVATENGGPVDIIGACHNGILVDPLDTAAIAEALLKILSNPKKWEKYSRNGLTQVRKLYSWEAHAQKYLKTIEPLLERRTEFPKIQRVRDHLRYRNHAIFSDIDQSLLGSPEGVQEFARYLSKNRKSVFFGVATGRRLDSALAMLKKNALPTPDILITSLGTEIAYAPQMMPDSAWARHIDFHWNPKAIRRIMAELPGISLQTKTEQSRFKISYHYNAELAPSIDEINTLLRQEEQAVNLYLSFGQFFDIVPVRASKGLALRYFAQQWNIPLEHILVAGGSGADEDMIQGNTLAVVVANRHREELSSLCEPERIYFASQPYAHGIIEAIAHYDFLKKGGKHD